MFFYIYNVLCQKEICQRKAKIVYCRTVIHIRKKFPLEIKL